MRDTVRKLITCNLLHFLKTLACVHSVGHSHVYVIKCKTGVIALVRHCSNLPVSMCGPDDLLTLILSSKNENTFRNR